MMVAAEESCSNEVAPSGDQNEEKRVVPWR